MKKIAMTGASGFIGQHLLRHYLEEGAHVIAFVPDPENMGEFTKYPNFEMVKAFFEDFDHLSELTPTRDIDIFYYLSWGGYGKLRMTMPLRYRISSQYVMQYQRPVRWDARDSCSAPPSRSI